MNTLRPFAALTLAAGLLGMTACTSYYQVTDPSTGKTYYTTDYKQKDSGAVEFNSLRTGERVTVQNSAVKQVNEQQAKYGPMPGETTTTDKAATTKPAGSSTTSTDTKTNAK